MSGELRIRHRYKQYTQPWLDYLMVSKEEMEDILKDSDWHVDEYIEDDTPRFIAVLEKDDKS